MVSEDLDKKFKDPKDQLRIVFVCAMWMTGFDVPSCSTMYLDKPMRNHTLMQTIARANRVFGDKTNGLIIGYIDAFHELEKALAIYGSGSGGGVREGELPIAEKKELLDVLRDAVRQTTDFCTQRTIDLSKLLNSMGFERVKLLGDAVESIMTDEESELRFLFLSGQVEKIYKAILPDPVANEYLPYRTLFRVLSEKVRALRPLVDISGVRQTVERLLDESITAQDYADGESAIPIVDLSKIDFAALRAIFKIGHKRVEIAKLRNAIAVKLVRLARSNRSRVDYVRRFERMIEEYNSGSYNIEAFFEKLVNFAKELNAEEKRGIVEHLTEEELAIFDLLTKPSEAILNEEERQQVKSVAKELLSTLSHDKLVLDWRKKQQGRAAVRLAIYNSLDHLPKSYSEDLYERKCQLVYQHVYDSYYGSGKTIYNVA
jgi:type I restriction enzyme R subunit